MGKDVVNSNILVYGVKLKEKYKRKTELDLVELYNILRGLKSLKYKRGDLSSKWRESKNKELQFGIEVFEIPSGKSLDENEVVKVKFHIDKETRETLSTKDNDGKREPHRLPNNKNYCYLTHGCFIFKKKNGIIKVLLVLERRMHSLNLHHLLNYLESFFDASLKAKIRYEQLIPAESLMVRIDDFKAVKYALLHNQKVEILGDDGTGTRLEKKELDENNPRIVDSRTVQLDLVGEGVKNRIARLLKIISGKTELTENNLKELVSKTGLELWVKTEERSNYHWANLFSNTIFASFKLNLDEDRNVDSADFFKKNG